MWQLCPLCNGQGHVSKPKHVAGDVNQWASTSTSHVCWICNGKGIIQSSKEVADE